MKGVGTIYQTRASSGLAREFQRGFNRLATRIGKKGLVKKWCILKQLLRQDPIQWRDIHLHQIREICCKNARQRFAKLWMISANSKYTPTAYQIEITNPGTVEEILTGSSTEADIIPDGLQDTHHHFIHI